MLEILFGCVIEVEITLHVLRWICRALFIPQLISSHLHPALHLLPSFYLSPLISFTSSSLWEKSPRGTEYNSKIMLFMSKISAAFLYDWKRNLLTATSWTAVKVCKAQVSVTYGCTLYSLVTVIPVSTPHCLGSVLRFSCSLLAAFTHWALESHSVFHFFTALSQLFWGLILVRQIRNWDNWQENRHTNSRLQKYCSTMQSVSWFYQATGSCIPSH